MPEFTLIQQLCIWALPILLAITIHEAAHGYVAFLCGDTTAKVYGRLSLNPLKHIDPFGTVLLPLLIGALTQFTFLFGYAKPVPVNWSQLRKPKRDMVLVAFAGPLSNFIMAFLWAALLKAATFLHPEASMPALFLLMSARAGIIINLILALLNLIPIPPLDGSKILASFLSAKQAMWYLAVEPYGFILITILAFTGLLSYFLTPLINGLLVFYSFVFQL
ncbi:MAG: site-2 protease family protein [Legionella sp.]|nr:MAG: site-2 protease family protein [Legionella sp.]PJD99452.1 MAG: site-2 protease family protein [Legionella sp.]